MDTAQQSTYISRSRDILMIAVISGLGGVLSTYISYIGNVLNRLMGVPFGAGQFISGLHVYWLLMAACLVRKPGTATAAGLVKGLVEFFTGSTHGIPIILVCLIQGLVIDLVLFLSKQRISFPILAVAGALASLSNVLVFQILYFSGASMIYIGLICFASLVSGVVFGAYLANQSMGLLSTMRPGRYSWNQENTSSQKKKILSWTSLALAVVILLSFTGGAVYYFKNIYELPWQVVTLTVEGKVEQPLKSGLKVYADQVVSIKTELVGKVTYIPEQEYTGVPVNVLLREARPLSEAKELKVVASDGYEVTFDLEKVLHDDQMLISEDTGDDTTLRLIAANYEGGYWVRKVSRFIIQ
jgi:energy-coupling factor transport system substrate-specific component